MKTTYLETGETKVTHLDLEILINQDILALNISMNNTESVHVLVHSSGIQSNLKLLRKSNLNL